MLDKIDIYHKLREKWIDYQTLSKTKVKIVSNATLQKGKNDFC